MEAASSVPRPDHPHIVNPTGEFGPESYIDTGYASPAKYPSTAKRKSTKKQDNEQGPKKKRPELKLKLKKGMIQSTLDRWLIKPRTLTRVRFHERVTLKRILPHWVSWTSMSLKGFSDPDSAFAKKRLDMKQRMAQTHHRRRLTPGNGRRVVHILKRLRRENTKLGY